MHMYILIYTQVFGLRDLEAREDKKEKMSRSFVMEKSGGQGDEDI